MKGIVFTEFMEMVEKKFGFEVAHQLVLETNPESGGIYTAVGTYPHEEMVNFVVKLSEISEIPINDLLKVFGNYLFHSFTRLRSEFFTHTTSALDFLEGIESHIHVEVLKLYPNAELPRFQTKRIHPNTLEMVYNSSRSMWPLAEGLIQGCGEHFNQPLEIETTVHDEHGEHATFIVKHI